MAHNKIYVNFLLILMLFSSSLFSMPLPELDLPFSFHNVPPHRTLTARYFNASKWNYVTCYCTDNNSPIIVTWRFKNEIRTAALGGYIAIDTYNANHHGKLHFYNNSNRQDVSVRCEPQFEPPPRSVKN